MTRDRKPWSLDRRDVTVGTRSGGFGTKRRQPRIRSRTIMLTHRPTGIEVSGELPQRHQPYSKKEAAAMQQALYPTLLTELENKVARHLRIPGR